MSPVSRTPALRPSSCPDRSASARPVENVGWSGDASLPSPRRRARFVSAATPSPACTPASDVTRVESDLLGPMDIPADALYGIATARAMDNYHITGVKLKDFPEFIRALALTKRACAMANGKLGLLDPEIERAIVAACDELIDSDVHHGHFAVDMIQRRRHLHQHERQRGHRQPRRAAPRSPHRCVRRHQPERPR